ncbi:MAG TPA: hypothetical protein VN256_26380 [Pyrinomonadaceae bacterium]|nr:hypothetical protein [Pyrinomonadaceae bacterium]
MDEEKKNEASSAEDEGVDFGLAMEAGREASTELLRSRGGIELEDGGFYLEEELTDEEMERRIEEGLKELNKRGNELYRRKKQEHSK